MAAGQTVSVVVTPTNALQPQVSFGSGTTVIQSAQAAAAGDPVLLETMPIATTGSYTVTVSAVVNTITVNGKTTTTSTTGSYTVAVYLNAALSTSANGGAPINTLAAAQNIDNSFISLPGGKAQRAAVVGAPATEIGPDGSGYEALQIAPQFVDISSGANVGTAILKLDDDNNLPITPSPTFSFSFYGATYHTFYVDSNGFISMTSVNDDDDGTFINTSMTDPFVLTQPIICPLWDDLVVMGGANSAVYWKEIGSGTNAQLIVQYNQMTFFDDPSGPPITFEVILNANGTMLFNYQNL